MLQIPPQQLFSKAKSYTALAELYLPEAINIPAIPTPEQDAVLQELNSQLNKEQFYSITDVKTGEITYCNGINHWLGYADNHFTKKKYLYAIHPAHAVVQGLYAISLFDSLINKQITPKLLLPTCIATLALKHKNGKYLYCKKLCSAWQLTSDGKMTAYISEFTIVKAFAGENYSIRLWNEDDPLKDSNEVLKKIVQKEFETASLFSVQELRILKRYASLENATSEMIATAFKIKKGTVDTFNKRIMKKCENILGLRFSTAKKTAEYFKSVDLI
jgi:hypothetical protein